MLLDQQEHGTGIRHHIRRARLLTNLPLNLYLPRRPDREVALLGDTLRLILGVAEPEEGVEDKGEKNQADRK